MIRMGPGRKLICIPDSGITVLSPGGGAAAATGWWLSGGISASDVAGVWQAKGAASLAASYLRLAGDQGYANIDPAVVGGVAPTWNSTDGWIGTGTQWLDTGINPADTYSAIVRFAVNAGDYQLFGCNSPNKYMMIRASLGGNVTYQYRTTVPLDVAPALASGTLAVTPTNAYRNGVPEGVVQGGFGTIARPIYVLARNSDGTASNKIVGNIQAISFYKTTLTAPQVALLSAAMAAL